MISRSTTLPDHHQPHISALSESAWPAYGNGLQGL
jgi:hypothetical protein